MSVGIVQKLEFEPEFRTVYLRGLANAVWEWVARREECTVFPSYDEAVEMARILASVGETRVHAVLCSLVRRQAGSPSAESGWKPNLRILSRSDALARWQADNES